MIVLAIFFALIEFWWGLVILFVLVIIGIYIIGHSHHPNQVLSLEFRLKASRKLSMLKAIQLGTAMIMFLATYMRRVVSVNFSAAGSTDSLHIVEGILSNQGGSYGQQGAYFLNLFNTISGGSLCGSYRYATNTAQMMDSSAGRAIIMWILLLMIAPAFCVVAQFFKDLYSRNATLVGSIISTISLCLTPTLMRRWVIEYGMQNNVSQQAAAKAISVGSMAYVAIICSFVLLFISLYRFIKKDNFE
ncbi:D-ala,d-ala ligase [Lactobacillus kalixensis DSM 16043]|uniref:D-ala,d-ala ligase n=1 Tax=Lactobacillus kalixensis DSM 16043 TaxID=1423763 RepID=A0A0R1U7C5_9LACO|nr:D-ala,d-ala ligase [Lactobacillus kalixensis DSM 16043]